MNPLAIVQARLGSRRLPRKMLLDLGGRPVIQWAWQSACDAFGAENVVVAVPLTPENDELVAVVESFGGRTWRWEGPEWDVLGRFWACAHAHRWHPDSVIVRITPDDPFKSPELMRRVAFGGERLPVEQSAEAFTLAQLDGAVLIWQDAYHREHLTLAMYPGSPPPKAPAGVWTIDTAEDLADARELVARLMATVV